MDQTTATRNIQNLEKLNLISQHEGKDRRFRMISITGEGKKKLQQVLPIWDQDQEMINQAIGKDKIASLEIILREILETLQKKST